MAGKSSIFIPIIAASLISCSSAPIHRKPSSERPSHRAANEIANLLNEPLYFTVKSCHAATGPVSLDPQEVCSRNTIADLLAWGAGFDSECRGEKADQLLVEVAQNLAEKLASRARILATLEGISPEDRREGYGFYLSELPPELVPEDTKDWVISERYLSALRRFVESQATFSDQEKVLFYEYFQNAYVRVNTALRKGGAVRDCSAPLVNAMATAFKRLPQYRGTVWRGLSLPESTLEQYQPGAELVWPAFSSTSKEQSVAQKFAVPQEGQLDAVFKISSQTCVDAVGASDKLREAEVLCLPGTRVKVIARDSANQWTLEQVE